MTIDSYTRLNAHPLLISPWPHPVYVAHTCQVVHPRGHAPRHLHQTVGTKLVVVFLWSRGGGGAERGGVEGGEGQGRRRREVGQEEERGRAGGEGWGRRRRGGGAGSNSKVT